MYVGNSCNEKNVYFAPRRRCCIVTADLLRLSEPVQNEALQLAPMQCALSLSVSLECDAACSTRDTTAWHDIMAQRYYFWQTSIFKIDLTGVFNVHNV